MIDHRPLSPEATLVFRSANPAAKAEELRAVGERVRDWERVAYVATREAAVPVLWRAIAPLAPRMPRAVAQHLLNTAVTSDLTMQQLSRRLQQTLLVFRERGLPVLLLKGAAVCALTDASFRSRPMTDLDLLFHPADIGRAREALEAAEWTETTNEIYLDLLQDAHHVPPYVDERLPGMRVEPHRMLMPDDNSFGFRDADLWREARPAPAPFDGAHLPSDVHLVLHASVHFAWQHRLTFGAWRTFRSVALITARPGFDWDALVQSALTTKAGSSVYWTLRIGHALAALTVPADALRRLAPPTPEPIRAMVERHTIAHTALGEGPRSPSVLLSRTLWRTALRPRWSGHAPAERFDPEHRWEKAYGVDVAESAWHRVRRQASQLRAWSDYLRGTVFGWTARS